MNKKKDKWLMFISVFVLISVLVSCSSNTPSENEKTNNPVEGTTEDSDSGDGGITGTLEIQYFVGGYGDEWWKDVIAGFKEQYPDVEVVEHAGPNINEQMRTRWISNDPPDLVYIDGAGINETQMVEDGQLMDLTDWVSTLEMEDGSLLMDNFIVDPFKHDGKIYSLPVLFDAMGTWYDKAWFETNGFEVPTDFNSWMDSMKKINEKEDIPPFVTTGVHAQYFLQGVLYPAFASAGGEELLNDIVSGEEGAWTNELVLDVMNKVKQMREEGYIDPGFAAVNHTQSQMNFLLHKNAFIPVGFWLPSEMANDIPEDFEFGYTPTPMNDEGEPMAVVPDLRPLAIAKEAKNPEAAKAFIEYAFSKENAAKFAKMTGALMDIKGVDLNTVEGVPGYLKDANELINNPEKVAIYQIEHQMNENLMTPIKDAIVSFMLGEIDTEEFSQKAEEAAKDYRNSK